MSTLSCSPVPDHPSSQVAPVLRGPWPRPDFGVVLYERRDGVQRPTFRYLALTAEELALRGLRAPSKVLLALLRTVSNDRGSDRDDFLAGPSAEELAASVGTSATAITRARDHLARAGLLTIARPDRRSPSPPCRRPTRYRVAPPVGPIVHVPSALVRAHGPELALLVAFIAWRSGDGGPRPLPLPEVATALGIARSSAIDTVSRAVGAGLLARLDAPGATAYAVRAASWLHAAGALRDGMRPLPAPIPCWLVDGGHVADDVDDAPRGLSRDLPAAAPSPSLSPRVVGWG